MTGADDERLAEVRNRPITMSLQNLDREPETWFLLRLLDEARDQLHQMQVEYQDEDGMTALRFERDHFRAELARLRSPSSALKQQVDAVIRDYPNWPEWRRNEIEAEVQKTPDRRSPASADMESEPSAYAMALTKAATHSAYRAYGDDIGNKGISQFIDEANARAIDRAAREAREAAIADCCAAICFGCAHGWETGYNEQYDPDHRTLMHKAPGATELGHKCDASAIRALSGTAPQAAG